MISAELIQSLTIVFLFLLAVFFFSSYLKKTLNLRRNLALGVNFKIVSKLPLSNKSFLYIIQIGKNYILIGASENNITAIADLTKIFQSNNLASTPSLNIQKNFETPQTNNEDISFKNFIKETFRKSKN
ncbi:MAG: flagellar biosynthetic protein FliO [Candidatus Kapaibacteriota bacterium]|jgi:flagellar biogenesis protein FliO